MADQVVWGLVSRGVFGYKAHRYGVTDMDLQAIRRFFPDPASDDPLPEAAAAFSGSGRAALARLNYWAAYSLHAHGDLAEAAVRQRKACELFAAVGDVVELGFATGYLSRHYAAAGRLADAVVQARACIHVVTSLPPDFPARAVWSRLAGELLAHALYERGESGGAAEAYHTARLGDAVPPEALRDGYREIVALNDLRYGEFLLSLGRLDEAESVVTAAPSTPLADALRWVVRGKAALLRGHRDEAGRLLGMGVAGVEEFHVHDYTAQSRLAQAAYYRQAGQPAAAESAVRRALAGAERYGLRLREADCLMELASLYGATPGGLVRAGEYLNRAGQIIAQCGYNRRLADLAALRQELGCRAASD